MPAWQPELTDANPWLQLQLAAAALVRGLAVCGDGPLRFVAVPLFRGFCHLGQIEAAAHVK